MILTARDHSASLAAIVLVDLVIADLVIADLAIADLAIADLVVRGRRSPVRVGVTGGHRAGAGRGHRRIRSPGPGDQILDSACGIRHGVLAEADRRGVLE